MKNNDLAPGDRLEPVLRLMETDPAAALPRLEALLDLYALDPRLHFMRGSLLAGLERFGEAREAMHTAVEIAPDYALARFQLGFLALTSGDTSGARAIWLPLLNLPAENPLNLFVQGLGAMLANQFEDAIGRLEAGIERNALVPLNQNMALLVQDMREKLNPQGAENEIESRAHFLLKQYSFKTTRH